MMKGRLYRRMKDGYIYEVTEWENLPGVGTRWTLWNDRAGERQFAMDVELQRQVGWELVGTAPGVVREETTRPRPAALMK